MRTHISACLLLLIAIGFGLPAHSQPYWDDPSVYRINKIQPHDRILPEGPWGMTLDGNWSNSRPSKPATDGEYTLSRNFTLPSAWQGRRTIFKLPVSASAVYLYVNGREAGYSQDARTPAEWDITRYLQPGSNRLVLRMLPQSDGSSIEHPSPLNTPPTLPFAALAAPRLISLPPVHITDIKILSTLDTTDYRTGLIDVMLDLNREVQGGSVEIELCGQRIRKRLEPRDWFIFLRGEVGRVTPWTDTTPALYPLVIKLYDPDGHETERIVKPIGFRNISVRDGHLCLNGSPLQIRGLHLTPSSLPTAGTPTPDDLRKLASGLRQSGANAALLPFPLPEEWYDLCDSLGILLFDQANIQTDLDHSLADNREWLNAFLDRIYNLYKRDRNHPSVIAWSLAGGHANGWCMEEAHRFLKGKDNTRPVVYAGAGLAWNTDIVVPRLAGHIAPALLHGPRPCLPVGDCGATADAAGIPLPQGLFLTACPDAMPTAESWQSRQSLPAEEEPPADTAPLYPDLPLPGDDLLSVVAAVSSLQPSAQSPAGYLRQLTDSLYADPDAPSGDWVAWRGADTVSLVLALSRRAKLGEIAASVLHNPGDSVAAPLRVQVRWSPNGKRWSRWRDLHVQNPIADTCDDILSLRYSCLPRRTRAVRFVSLRFVCRNARAAGLPCRPTVPTLMVDEVEITEK